MQLLINRRSLFIIPAGKSLRGGVKCLIGKKNDKQVAHHHSLLKNFKVILDNLKMQGVQNQKLPKIIFTKQTAENVPFSNALYIYQVLVEMRIFESIQFL